MRLLTRSLCSDLDAELGLRRSAMRQALKGQRQRVINTEEGKALQRERVKQPAEDPRESGPVARIATAPLKVRAADALVADYETKARELYKTTPGFVGALLLLDGEKRNARSITVWECKADMDVASEAGGYTDAMKAIAGHFVDAPDVETWRLGTSLFANDAAVPGSLARAPTTTARETQ